MTELANVRDAHDRIEDAFDECDTATAARQRQHHHQHHQPQQQQPHHTKCHFRFK